MVDLVGAEDLLPFLAALQANSRPLGLIVGSWAKVPSPADLVELLNASEAKAMSMTEVYELSNASERRRGDESTAELG